MCTSFTEHVRTFGPDCDLAACVLPRLADVLRREMRQRHLLDAPPSYLGFPEASSWHAPEVFDDLLAECYLFAIVKRINGLRNQLNAHANIDGFITRNVRNFLFERQLENDPIGYATFGNVEAATNALEEIGELTVEERVRGRLVNASLIRFGGAPVTDSLTNADALRAVLEGVPGWRKVLPELVATTDDGQLWLAGYLRALARSGITSVRASDLVAALATRIRADWSARNATPPNELALEGEEDDLVRVVRLVLPDSSIDDRHLIESLERLVPERIARIEDADVRARLDPIFRAIIEALKTGMSPVQADLVRRLGIARSTMSRDFVRLQKIFEEILADDGTNGSGAS
jgi:hypothetical protein